MTRPLGSLPPETVAPREWPGHVILFFLGFALGFYLLLNSLPRGCGGPLTACKSNCKNIATALEMYASDNGGYYPDQLEPALIQGNYLKFIPTCPGARRVTYLDYHTYRHRTGFRFSCVGNNHGKAYTGFNAPADNFPRYDADQGLLDHP